MKPFLVEFFKKISDVIDKEVNEKDVYDELIKTLMPMVLANSLIKKITNPATTATLTIVENKIPNEKKWLTWETMAYSRKQFMVLKYQKSKENISLLLIVINSRIT